MYTSNVSPANLVLSALVVLFKDDIPGPVSTTIPCLRPEIVQGFTLANALYITQGVCYPTLQEDLCLTVSSLGSESWLILNCV